MDEAATPQVMEAWVAEAMRLWEEAFGVGSITETRIVLALEPLVKAYGWEKIRPCWEAYLRHVEGEVADPRAFSKMVPISDEKPKEQKPERITEAELERIEREQKGQTQLEPAPDYSLVLVAEVRRMRALIASGRNGAETLYSEAQAIAEEKIHE